MIIQKDINLLFERHNHNIFLFVYDLLSNEEKSNGKTYFVPDDETTSDGTDLTQFAKTTDLEDGTITVGNSSKLDGSTKDEIVAEINESLAPYTNNLFVDTVNVASNSDIQTIFDTVLSAAAVNFPSHPLLWNSHCQS